MQIGTPCVILILSCVCVGNLKFCVRLNTKASPQNEDSNMHDDDNTVRDD